MNRGGGEEWRIGGKFETKRNADRERTKAFTVDRALPQLPPLFGSNRFVLFWDNVDEVLLRGSVSIDNLQNSPPCRDRQIFLSIYSISLVTTKRPVAIQVFKRREI